jgi:quercetin dioxygenase-like cupin family protein
MLYLNGVGHAVKRGSVAYIEGEKLHQFTNTVNSEFRFICVVPTEGDSY